MRTEFNRHYLDRAVVRSADPNRIMRLRWPVCQDRFERLDLDSDREGTVCRGCLFDLRDGCPNTRAWSLDCEGIKPVCEAGDLVYCRHYDCGCDLCANFHGGVPLPLAARGSL